MEKKKHSVERKIYFTDDEWEQVEKRAALLGVRPNYYVRDMAVNGEIKHYDFAEYQSMLYPLRGIGININQIAAVANSTGSVFEKDIADIKVQFAKLKELFDEYFKELKYTQI